MIESLISIIGPSRPSGSRPSGRAARSGGPVALLLACVMALGMALPATQSAHAAPAPESFADLAEELSPAVVNISTTQTVESRSGQMPEVPPGSPFEDLFKDFFERGPGQQRQRRVTSLGSGFVIDPKGVVVTNTHVIDGADEIVVSFIDGDQLDAEVVGRDKETDIAILRVEPEKPLKAVSFGNSKDLRVGDWVLAIGNPFGLGGTVTAGIVSGRNRQIGAGSFDDFIQTDAAINRGNSGGPLFDLKGRVVGVNTAIFSQTGGSVGVGFAVPASLARSVVRQILEYGETRRGWLGVRIQTVTPDIAESLGLKEAGGALVADVTEGGPAEKGGIEVGDLIVKFNNQKVESMRELPRIVAETPIGRKVPVEVLRDGKRKTVRVEVGRRETGLKLSANDATPGPASGKERKMADLGLTLAEITPELRRRYRLPDTV
ncbi:MAG: Do family serine endopeptidase, partial [Alphaproteobacteria bacterium]